jgi:hypothetical protein
MKPKSLLTHSSVTDSGMKETFSVFRQELGGSFSFVGSTDTLAQAREKVVQNPASSDYEFLIVNALTGEKTIIEPSERPNLAAQSPVSAGRLT